MAPARGWRLSVSCTLGGGGWKAADPDRRLSSRRRPPFAGSCAGKKLSGARPGSDGFPTAVEAKPGASESAHPPTSSSP